MQLFPWVVLTSFWLHCTPSCHPELPGQPGLRSAQLSGGQHRPGHPGKEGIINSIDIRLSGTWCGFLLSVGTRIHGLVTCAPAVVGVRQGYCTAPARLLAMLWNPRIHLPSAARRGPPTQSVVLMG